VAIPENRPASRALPGGERLDLRKSIALIRAQRTYSRFLLGSFVYHWGLHLPIPLYAIYRVRVLHITDGWIGTLAMVESAVTIVTYFAWGRLAQRRGSRLVLLLGSLLVCFFPFLTALSRSMWSLVFASIVAGIAAPAFNLGLFNGLLEVTPVERRATYVAVFNSVMNIAAFVSPLVGTTAAEWIGIRQALFVGGALRVVGFLAFAYALTGFKLPQGIRRATRS
jgi:MFS family permease